MKIKEISFKEAKEFIEKWHYSHLVPKGKNVFFGCFYNDQLYAVANYGHGVNPVQAQFLKRITGHQDIDNNNLFELKRLCRIEPRNDIIPLTKFLSKCHKLLRKMNIKYIISFSDPEHNHNGGIYKAANFIHLGKTQKETHYMDINGNLRHRRYPYRYAKFHDISMKEAVKILKLTPRKTLEKDRWFIKLC